MTLGLSPVPPQRQAAIIIPQDVPVYRIGEGKFFGPDDTLYPEGSIIVYEMEPNAEMEPMNALADERMKELLNKLDKEGRKVATKTGKHYTSLADAFEQSRILVQQEAKTFKVLSGRKEKPIMNAKKDHIASKIKKIELTDAEAPIFKPTKDGGN